MQNHPKVAFITGASSGIGRATALLLGKQGDPVACVARDAHRLADVVAEIEKSGGHAMPIVCDVTQESQVKDAVAKCVDALGGIDFLLPAAGIIATGTLESTPLSDYDHMMNVNVRSVLCTMKHCIPHLFRRPGSIVTISSTTGYRAFPNVFAYCLSKAAIEQATRCLALELAPKGVRVNCIAPGVIVSELHKRGGMDDHTYREFLERSRQTHPLGHVGEVADAAETIAFLAGDKAKWLTGTVVPVDGGRGITCLR
ncbi:MAG: SDR family oxidoreductase [Planctomycetes bacterium]|nr:SDR family oxidoreductase [Planctomycetota bacterium]